MNSLPTIGEATILGLSTLQFGLSCSLGASAGGSSRACSSLDLRSSRGWPLGYPKGAGGCMRNPKGEGD
jgi:hypothetical protein